MPSIFNSQPNEEIFRRFRSMGTMNFTKINFTLLELFHLVGRVELQNDIVHFKLADVGVFFPRNKINQAKFNPYKLPSDEEIEAAILNAKTNAIEYAFKFGMNIELHEIEKCELSQSGRHREQHVDTETDSEERFIQNLQNTTCDNQNIENDHLVEIILDCGVKKKIRKSTLIWNLTDSRKHLSNDRLKRVQDASQDNKPPKCRRLEFKKTNSPNHVPIFSVIRTIELQIGNWCFFRFNKKTNVNDAENMFVLGHILSFRYMNGKNKRDKEYSWDFAPVSPDEKSKKRGIEVLATWFKVESNSNFPPIDRINSFYININKYVSSLECSTIKLIEETGCLSLSNKKNVSESLLNELLRMSEKI